LAIRVALHDERALARAQCDHDLGYHWEPPLLLRRQRGRKRDALADPLLESLIRKALARNDQPAFCRWAFAHYEVLCSGASEQLFVPVGRYPHQQIVLMKAAAHVA